MHVPWPEDTPLDFTAVAKRYFGGSGSVGGAWHEMTFQSVLKPLSMLGVENVPDLMEFLPSPDAKDFSSKAAGLLILLDQAPRALLSGVSNRYIFAYFDQLAIKLARQLDFLPVQQTPFTLENLMAQGWSFDYSTVMLLWLIAIFAHSEDIGDHARGASLAEELRRAVEDRAGKTDPARLMEEENSTNVHTFLKLMIYEPPKWEGTKQEDFVFWLLRVFRAHTPFIRKFGRYPYRNASMGRVSTAEEIQYLEETSYFAAEENQEVIKRIRQDVEAGDWSPLDD